MTGRFLSHRPVQVPLTHCPESEHAPVFTQTPPPGHRGDATELQGWPLRGPPWQMPRQSESRSHL
jgi:hypothetical protein